MEITFNLKDAQVFIPHGRIMNLKSELQWGKLEFSKEEIKEAVNKASREDYNVNLNFDKAHVKHINNFTNDTWKTSKRLSKYNELALNVLAYNDPKINISTEKCDKLFPMIYEEILVNEKYATKMKKLEQLRLINATN